MGGGHGLVRREGHKGPPLWAEVGYYDLIHAKSMVHANCCICDWEKGAQKGRVLGSLWTIRTKCGQTPFKIGGFLWRAQSHQGSEAARNVSTEKRLWYRIVQGGSRIYGCGLAPVYRTAVKPDGGFFGFMKLGVGKACFCDSWNCKTFELRLH